MASLSRSIISLGLCLTMLGPRVAQAAPVSRSVSLMTSAAVVTLQGSEIDEDAFANLPPRRRERLARRVFAQAEKHRRAGQLMLALEKYEQTYRLVPHKHGLAYKIGMTYRELGNCEMAVEFLTKIVELGGDIPKLREKVSHAQEVLAQLRSQGCSASPQDAPVPEPESAPQEPEPEPEPAEDDGLTVLDEAAEQAEEEEEEEEESEPVYDGPTVAQASLDENPLGVSSQEQRQRKNKDFRRARSRGFLISGIIFSSLGALGLGAAGFLHWKTQDIGQQLVNLSNANQFTQYPNTDFGCRYLDPAERKNRCPPLLIRDFETYQGYTPIAYGVGGGLLGLGLTFILIKQIRMARYKKRRSRAMVPRRLKWAGLSTGLGARRLGARASFRF